MSTIKTKCIQTKVTHQLSFIRWPRRSTTSGFSRISRPLFKTTISNDDLDEVMNALKSSLNLSECYAKNLDSVQRKPKRKPTAHNMFIGALMTGRRRNMKEAHEVYKKVMQHRMKYAAMKIQRAWRERIADPVYQICRNRLMYEFSSENLSGFPMGFARAQAHLSLH